MNIIVAGVLPPFTLNLWQDISAMLQYDFMRQDRKSTRLNSSH